MTTATWPAEVPFRFLHSSYKEQLGDNAYKFEPTEGRPITRRKASKRTDTISGQIPLSLSQYNWFLYFYESTLFDGTIPFNAPHPRILDVRTFQITEQPDWEPYGTKGLLNLSMTLDATFKHIWILDEGSWADTGFWDDAEFWQDS